MEKSGCLVRTPTPIDRTPTAVDIVARMDEYTEIMLAYARALEQPPIALGHTSRALQHMPRVWEEPLREQEQPRWEYKSSHQGCASTWRSAWVAIKSVRTAQAKITKMLEGEETSWWSWTFTSELVVHFLYVIYMIDACEPNFYVTMMELNFCFWTTSELHLCHLYCWYFWTYFLWCSEDCYMTFLHAIG